MVQNFYNYEPNLPKTVQSKAKFNEAYTTALNAVEEAKTHWVALLSIQEIKDRLQDINKALDEREEISLYLSQKIREVEALPIPQTEKAKLIQEWKNIKADAERHLTGLEEALDSLPCGYITYENDNPDSLSITNKDLLEYATKQSTIKTPTEAHELYEKFMAAIKAIQDFHKYEREEGYNERDFISIIGHIHNAEEFASNFIYGTWKTYK